LTLGFFRTYSDNNLAAGLRRSSSHPAAEVLNIPGAGGIGEAGVLERKGHVGRLEVTTPFRNTNDWTPHSSNKGKKSVGLHVIICLFAGRDRRIHSKVRRIREIFSPIWIFLLRLFLLDAWWQTHSLTALRHLWQCNEHVAAKVGRIKDGGITRKYHTIDAPRCSHLIDWQYRSMETAAIAQIERLSCKRNRVNTATHDAPHWTPKSNHSIYKETWCADRWAILLRWGIRLTGLVSTLVLARILTPSDFGVVAIAMLVVGND